jgi:hypothetical protein
MILHSYLQAVQFYNALTSMLRFLAATITSGSSAASLPAATSAAVALLLLLLLGSTKNCANRCRLLARSAVESPECIGKYNSTSSLAMNASAQAQQPRRHRSLSETVMVP